MDLLYIVGCCGLQHPQRLFVYQQNHFMICKRHPIILCFVLFCSMNDIIAQPADYTQWWNARLSANPAYTGQGIEKHRGQFLYQTRSYNDTLSMQTIYASFEYRVDFLNTKKGYGLVLTREHPFSLGFGLMAERRFSNHSWYPYLMAGGSISAIYGFSKNSTITLGLQPAYYEAAGYYPYPEFLTLSLSDTVVLPGHAPFRKFSLNAGVHLGIGKMDCWADDLLHRFEAGIAVYNAFMDYRTLMPDVHPGRQIHAHAGGLLPAGQKLGLVPRVFYLYEGQSLYNIGLTVIHRRHFGMADRLRLVALYRSTGHLAVGGGVRVYGRPGRTFSADIEVSRDFLLKSTQTGWHRTAWEIALVLKPLKKCWSLDDCSGTYQYETF